jgi:hypothetical protein
MATEQPCQPLLPKPFAPAGDKRVDQLKEIYINGELETVDTTQWYPRVRRRDFAVGMVVSENGLDDPDQQF